MAIRYLIEKHYQHIDYHNSLNVFLLSEKRLSEKIYKRRRIDSLASKNFQTEIFRPETIGMNKQLKIIEQNYFWNWGAAQFACSSPRFQYSLR